MTLNCQLSGWVSSVNPHRTQKRCSSEELPYCLTSLFHCLTTGPRWLSCCHDHFNPWFLMKLSKRKFCALWHLARSILIDNSHVEWKNYLYFFLNTKKEVAIKTFNCPKYLVFQEVSCLNCLSYILFPLFQLVAILHFKALAYCLMERLNSTTTILSFIYCLDYLFLK